MPVLPLQQPFLSLTHSDYFPNQSFPTTPHTSPQSLHCPLELAFSACVSLQVEEAHLSFRQALRDSHLNNCPHSHRVPPRTIQPPTGCGDAATTRQNLNKVKACPEVTSSVLRATATSNPATGPRSKIATRCYCCCATLFRLHW